MTQLGPEVQLAWEVMTCLGLRTTYDRPDSPCHWFNAHYGPYPAYTLTQQQPRTLLSADESRTLAVATRGLRYSVPELMSGCRRAPIMSIGINPNLTASQRSVRGATWCYPFFDDIAKYADHFRNRTIHQERFPVELVRKYIVAGTETVAESDGEVTDITWASPKMADNIAISVSYADRRTDVLRVPVDHEVLCDTSQTYRNFRKGDILAGKLELPEGVAANVIQERVGYYEQFQKIIERFKSSDPALQSSEVQIGEDACQADMVACPSPGWNAYFPDVVREGVANECVARRRYLARQLIQTRPAAIVFAGSSAVEMFLDSLKNELASGQVKIDPPVDLSKDTVVLLRESLSTRYMLQYQANGVSFDSRLVFSPHFSYGDNFTAGCWMRGDQWGTYEKSFPADAAKVEKTKKLVQGAVVLGLDPGSDEWKGALTAVGAEELSKYYLDPVGTIASVLLQEYGDDRPLRLDSGKKHLVRTRSDCQFCDNALFQLPGGCRYLQP